MYLSHQGVSMPYEPGMSLFGLTITQDPYFEAWKHEPGCRAIGTKGHIQDLG